MHMFLTWAVMVMDEVLIYPQADNKVSILNCVPSLRSMHAKMLSRNLYMISWPPGPR